MSYAGNWHAQWLKESGLKVSDLGAEVANIVGYVGRGLYNAPMDVEKTNWNRPDCIEILWNHSLANWDFCDLTRLWVECARRMMRVDISGRSNGRLRLLFHKRAERIGPSYERLPDVEELVAIVDRDFARNQFVLP